MPVIIMLKCISIAVVILIATTWSVQASENEACGQKKFSGRSALYDEFPWMVKILEKNNDGGLIRRCRGTLIHPKIVLTTAHCVQTFENQPEKLQVEASDFNSYPGMILIDALPEQERSVSKIVLHENFYSKTRINNFALLVLSQPIISSENICLPDDDDDFDGHHCFIARDTGLSSGTLKRVDLSVISHDQCQTFLRKTIFSKKRFNLDQSLMCADNGKNKAKTCGIDEGSPLICPIFGMPNSFVQIGIANAGKFGCISNKKKDIISVYSNVVSVKSWIDEQMEVLESDLESDISSYSP